MTNVIRASVSPNIPRPIWYALCAAWSVSLKTGYCVTNERHPAMTSLSGETLQGDCSFRQMLSACLPGQN